MTESTAAVLHYRDSNGTPIERPVTASQLQHLVDRAEQANLPVPQLAYLLLECARHEPRINAILARHDQPCWPDWLGPRPDGMLAPDDSPMLPAERWRP